MATTSLLLTVVGTRKPSDRGEFGNVFPSEVHCFPRCSCIRGMWCVRFFRRPTVHDVAPVGGYGRSRERQKRLLRKNYPSRQKSFPHVISGVDVFVSEPFIFNPVSFSCAHGWPRVLAVPEQKFEPCL